MKWVAIAFAAILMIAMAMMGGLLLMFGVGNPPGPDRSEQRPVRVVG